MTERNSSKILLWGIGTFLALSAIATIISVPIMINRPESTETGSTTTTQLPEVPQSSSSEPSSSPSISTTTRASTTRALTTRASTIATPTPVPPSFEDTIIDGSKYGISFKPPGNEKIFNMTMMYTDGKVNPGDPVNAYSFLVMTENDNKTIFYHYPGNDTSLEHLYMFHDAFTGFKWDRTEPDAEIIKGKSENDASEEFSNFNVRFTDKEIVIYVAPSYEQVLYVSEETWMNCAQPDCYTIRIGNPDDLDKSLYTFLVDPE